MNGCGCRFELQHRCPMCGHQWTNNHCPHDGVQSRCKECGWIDLGKRSPLEFLGVVSPPSEDTDAA
jgi:hypothetical protein